MKNKKYSLKFMTISKISISSRNYQALYQGLDYDIGNNTKIKSNFSIIYPFQSYTDRSFNLNNEIDYYIPASSVKGALEIQEKIRGKLTFNNSDIKEKDILVTNIFKFQYLLKNSNIKANTHTEQFIKSPKYQEFFPKIGIEMLNNQTTFIIDIITSAEEVNSETIENILRDTHEITLKKLDNYYNKIIEELKLIQNKKDKIEENSGYDDLVFSKDSIQRIKEMYPEKKSRGYLMFLGGFKGLFGTNEFIKFNSPLKSGFYFDRFFYNEEEFLLPYGLVQVKLKK